MKNTILFALGLIFTANSFAQQDPVLMEIDGKKVTKSEFQQIYLKNNNDPKYDQASLDAYLELFKKFKLKVAEAEALGYDTLPKLKRELEGYQAQLALPYLTDTKMNEAMVKEAYERMKTEVRASHILIRLDPNPTAQDTLKAYNRIMALKARIDKGEDFSSVAKSNGGSEDPSVKNNGGDLGFFTAFQMVYQFEEKAYTTAIGSTSMPFRTKFGYHIIKVTDKRAARGTMKAAHLMIAANKESAAEDIAAAENKANELYAKIKSGDSYEELVRQYSDDPTSSTSGGVLPPFGTGTTTRMVPEFEAAAFELKNNGDVAMPVRTDYGFHIIKRIEWTPLKSFEELQKELQNRVNKDDRAKLTQSSFIQNLKKEYAFKDKSKKSIKWFNKNIDSTYFQGKWTADGLKSDKKMFTVDGKTFGQQAFADYLEKNFRTGRAHNLTTVTNEMYKAFVNESILEIEKEKLPRKHPEYRALMNEYHDGILLYEIMSDKVWNKAMIDTTGLKAFYQENKSKYMWGKRVDAVVYECLNSAIAEQVYKLAQSGIDSDSIAKIINKDSELNLRIRKNKFEVEKTNYLNNQKLNGGVNMPYTFDGKTYVVHVKEQLMPMNKELLEAKGIITSDYQNFLEKAWLEELASKHNIKINTDVLYSVGK